MFAGGLNQLLTESLSQVSQHVPGIANEIQERLLDLLSMTLCQKPFNFPGTPMKWRKTRASVNFGSGGNSGGNTSSSSAGNIISGSSSSSNSAGGASGG